MGINLTVNNNTYDFPTQGSEPGWGGDNSGWAEAVTTVLDSLAGTGTINETQALIELAVGGVEIPGLIFNNSIVESGQVIYRIFRSTTGGSIEQLSESGLLNLVYDPATASWLMTRQIMAGDGTRVNLQVDALGQVSYSSLALTGTGYTGYIKFKTITILRT